ncbi:MAG: ABC transporter ATP-binding protein, partial [Lamprocystis purpurea]|nr:ABC transporter ATP-binding protein [Lamprocystis purpurea]
FDGDLDDYPAWLAARDPDATGPGVVAEVRDGTDRTQQRRAAAEVRKVLQPLRNQLKALEQQCEVLTARRTALATALADPELYAADAKPRLLSLLEEQRRVAVDLAAARGSG